MASSQVQALTAGDVMSRQLITAPPDLSLEDAAALMRERMITGLPVVDSEGRLVGVISVSDLAHEVEDPGPGHDFYQRSDHPAAWAPPHQSHRHRTVADRMTRLVMAVDESDSLMRVMDQMLDFRVHRVIVTSQERPVGIISALDLVRVLRDQEA